MQDGWVSADPDRYCHLRGRLSFWLFGSLIGTILIGLPDDDVRLFSLSRTHGPSLVDTLGVLVLILAWLPTGALLWTRRRAIRGLYATIISLIGMSGLLILIISIKRDTGREWMVGAALLVGAQLIALLAVSRTRNG